MCGIAGYSLRSRSTIGRTLAAQALLAAIAERGADAVGYAYRAPEDTYATVVKQRTPASATPRTSVCARLGESAARPRARLHEGASLDLGQQPPGAPRAGGRDPQRDHPERRRAPRPPLVCSCRAAHDRRLRGDLRDRRPLAERRARARASTRGDGDLVGRRARAGRRVPGARQRPPAVGRRGPRQRLLRLDQGHASRSSSAIAASSCAIARSAKAPGSRSRTDGSPAASVSGPTSPTTKTTPSPRCAHRRSGSSASPASRSSPPPRGHAQRTAPSAETRAPSSSRRSRTRYWNVAQAPRRASKRR